MKLAEITGLTQGYISDIERGRQPASREFVKKISPVLELSHNDIVDILGITGSKKSNDLWPAAVAENHEREYGICGSNREKRLPENAPKRKFIDKVIKILESGNKKVVRALKSNIDAFSDMIEPRKPEIKEGD